MLVDKNLEEAVLSTLREILATKIRRVSRECENWSVVAYRVPPSTPQGHEIIRIDVVRV